MFAILHALGMLVADLFKSRRRLAAENLLLRHQLAIAMRRAPPRLRLRSSDRALLVWITQFWPSLLGALVLLDHIAEVLAALEEGEGQGAARPVHRH